MPMQWRRWTSPSCWHLLLRWTRCHTGSDWQERAARSSLVSFLFFIPPFFLYILFLTTCFFYDWNSALSIRLSLFVIYILFHIFCIYYYFWFFFSIIEIVLQIVLSNKKTFIHFTSCVVFNDGDLLLSNDFRGEENKTDNITIRQRFSNFFGPLEGRIFPRYPPPPLDTTRYHIIFTKLQKLYICHVKVLNFCAKHAVNMLSCLEPSLATSH